MWELRNTAPMLNLRYFLDPRFGVAAGVITLVFFGMFGFFFLLTQYFQLVLGYGTLEAGVKQLPFAAVMMVVAPNSPKFAARFGANVAVAIGLVGMSAGMFLFTLARTDTSYLQIVLVVMVMAAGMAMTIPTMTGSIMSAVPMGKAGVGSAMNDTTRELGGALGVAVLGSLVASRYDTPSCHRRSTCCRLRCKARQARASPVRCTSQPIRAFRMAHKWCRLRKKRSCPACISPQSSPAASRWSPPASCTASCRQAIRTPRAQHRSPGRPRISRSSDRNARVGPDSVLLAEHLAAVAELGFVDLATRIALGEDRLTGLAELPGAAPMATQGEDDRDPEGEEHQWEEREPAVTVVMPMLRGQEETVHAVTSLLEMRKRVAAAATPV